MSWKDSTTGRLFSKTLSLSVRPFWWRSTFSFFAPFQFRIKWVHPFKKSRKRPKGKKIHETKHQKPNLQSCQTLEFVHKFVGERGGPFLLHTSHDVSGTLPQFFAVSGVLFLKNLAGGFCFPRFNQPVRVRLIVSADPSIERAEDVGVLPAFVGFCGRRIFLFAKKVGSHKLFDDNGFVRVLYK